MLLYYHSWLFYNHFIATLYHFLGLTYWPSAQCQLLFFACFLHRRKSISNGVQTPRNFLDIFYGSEHLGWARAAPGGCPERGTTHQGVPGGPGAPRWVVPTSGLPFGTSLAHCMSSGPSKFSVKFHGVWTPFGTDILRCKTQAKNSNWHLALCQ